MTQKLKKGEIWLANLNPSKGTEPGKTRPVLILQDQALLNVSHPSTLIIPLTTALVENAYPLRIRIKARDALEKDSDLLTDQLRAIDNKRLIHGPLTIIEKSQLTVIYDAICEVLGMETERETSIAIKKSKVPHNLQA
jgi:mRNA interferase MazF